MLRCMLISILLCHSAAAGNPLFLPGDSFFAVRLDEELIEKLSNHKGVADFEFTYQRPYEAGMVLSGYLGAKTIRVKSFTEEMAQSVVSAYSDMRVRHPLLLRHVINIDGSVVVEEANPGYLFIYPKTFNFDDLRVGLKYNEDWMIESSPRRSDDIEDSIYEPFVDGLEIEDWRRSRGVLPLPVTVEVDSDERGRGLISVSPDDELVACLVAGDALQAVAERRERSHFWLIDRLGAINMVERRGGLWVNMPGWVNGGKK